MAKAEEEKYADKVGHDPSKANHYPTRTAQYVEELKAEAAALIEEKRAL